MTSPYVLVVFIATVCSTALASGSIDPSFSSMLQDAASLMEKHDIFVDFEDVTNQVERVLGSNRHNDFSVAGERCGRRNACQPGLDCNNLFPFWSHKQCSPPKDCLSSGMASFQERYNITEYKAKVFDHAGVTEGDLMQQLVAVNGNPSAFTELPGAQAVMHSLEKIFWEPAQELWAIQTACTYPALRNEENDNRFLQTTGSGALLLGLHIEAGFLVDGAFDFITVFSSEQTSTNATGQYVRFCGGLELGTPGFDISFLIGINGSGDVSNFQCASIVVDLDAAIGVGVGMQVGFDFQGGFTIEFTLGLGLGAGAGVGFCGSQLAPGAG